MAQTNIAAQIARIQAARNTMRQKLVALGLVDNTAKIEALAQALDEIENIGAVSESVTEGSTYTIPRGYHNGSGTVRGIAGGGNYSLQAKSVTPTKSQQSVTPDSGYYGLSSVTVAVIPEQYQDVQDVTATAADVVAGKVIVTSNGTVTPGTMADNGSVAAVINGMVTDSYTIPAGKHSGSGKVTLTADIETALNEI